MSCLISSLPIGYSELYSFIFKQLGDFLVPPPTLLPLWEEYSLYYFNFEKFLEAGFIAQPWSVLVNASCVIPNNVHIVGLEGSTLYMSINSIAHCIIQLFCFLITL